jgi:chromosome segregation ATPase
MGILLLAGGAGPGCGDEPERPRGPPAKGGTTQAQAGPDSATAQPAKADPARAQRAQLEAAERRKARRAELQKQEEELEERVKELERARKEMAERHTKEDAGLVEIDVRIRRRFLQYIRDARDAEHKLERMVKRFRELENVVQSGATGKLQDLRDARDEIEKRRDEIQNAWQRSQDEARLGKIEESPVKKDLYLVRAVKRQWFAISAPARRGRPKSTEKRTINRSFRAWLKEVPARKQIVVRVLAQPLGPKRTPDTYDFTNLDFYILLELLEDSLDRLNIAVENKELKRNRARLEQIQKELDTVEQRLNDHMAEGGHELSEYEDLLDRLPGARENASYLSTRVAEWARIFAEVEKIHTRQTKEADVARAALEHAREQLERVRRELRPLSD